MSINLMSSIFKTEFRDLQDADGNNTKASTAKFVCIALADHANDEGEGAYPSIDTLAYKTNLSRTAVINALDALKYNGVLIPNGASKRHTIDYTINKMCFSQGSQRGVLVNLLDPGSQPGILVGVNPVDPNHPLTINESSKPLSIENAIYANQPTTNDMLRTDEKQAIDAFEQAFGLERPWDWYPDTPADKKKTWTDFRAYVLKLYRQDNDCFTKYVTWSRTDYVKGAMTALGIKRNPENFPDSWSAYKLSAMYNKKTDEPQGEYRPRIGV